ncbi:hypothetical protein F2P81_000150 [Scophthalmus maximus]|uniref:Uncharacterized protein n=1 Tax=Scophthalmus maximus TaxID=52904 RepID=A0A6A4TIG8_SCOMX|nr:hypothetical protein F2P81_000150 [Scophthalmus maximus]
MSTKCDVSVTMREEKEVKLCSPYFESMTSRFPSAKKNFLLKSHRELTAGNVDQFEFALTAVAEEVNAILKALPQ